MENSGSFYIRNSVGFCLYLHKLDKLLLKFVISVHAYVSFSDIYFCSEDFKNMIEVFKPQVGCSSVTDISVYLTRFKAHV